MPVEFLRFRPATSCCGCASLLLGVELICLVNAIANLITLSYTSSVQSVKVMGVIIPVSKQLFDATWALLGLPVIMCAGVGAIYKIAPALRVYTVYLLITFVVVVMWWAYMLFAGGVCDELVPTEVQSMGSTFVCAFTDAFAVFWALVGGFIFLYAYYIVDSAAQQVEKSAYPDLLAYRKGAVPIGEPVHGQYHVA